MATEFSFSMGGLILWCTVSIKWNGSFADYRETGKKPDNILFKSINNVCEENTSQTILLEKGK